jgi:hypothetical protein
VPKSKALAIVLRLIRSILGAWEPAFMDTTKTTGKQREKRAGGVTGKGFQPGISGNPSGRPRTAKFSEAARQLLSEIDTKSGETNAEVLVRHRFKNAMRGSVRHTELFLAYSEGRPKQGVELSGPEGGAMRFENMSDAELDARLKTLLEKYQREKQI